MKSFLKIILLSLSICLTSCVGDLDLEQVNEIGIDPTIAVSLLNFELTEENLVDDINLLEEITIVEEVSLPDFDNALIQEDLDVVLLQFEILNTFASSFTVDFYFLDENDEITYAFESIEVPANSVEVLNIEEEIVILNNPMFLQSERISVSLTLNDTSIDTSQESIFDFKSAGVFYFSID